MIECANGEFPGLRVKANRAAVRSSRIFRDDGNALFFQLLFYGFHIGKADAHGFVLTLESKHLRAAGDFRLQAVTVGARFGELPDELVDGGVREFIDISIVFKF